MKYIATINDTDFVVELLKEGQLTINGKPCQVDLKRVDNGSAFSLVLDGVSYAAFVLEENGRMQVFIDGARYIAEVLDEHEKLLREVSASGAGLDDFFQLKAPMPGLVVKLPVAVGDVVSRGDVLVILESMKMQNELRAPQPGVVTEVQAVEGGSVEKRDVIIVLGPLEENGD
ncbi:MAG: biotin/lipoyl-binding protein [Anaerolineales bacterium]|nr:biotin/lipoyl-binding protein [Anaerolineales bacterium]